LRILILDDEKNRHTLFGRKLIGAIVTHVETVEECLREIRESELFDVIFLDHDLDGKIYVPSGPGTGYEVAEWLKNHPTKLPGAVILHTLNEYGAANMLELLPGAMYKPGIYAEECLNIEYLKNLSK